jgi:hypothetical protein
MKKTIIAGLVVLAALAAQGFAASVDFGGSLLNTTAYGNSSDAVPTPGGAPGLVQRDSGNLWFQAAFNDSVTFSAQAGASFSYTPLMLAAPMTFNADADLFKLDGTFPTPDTGISLFRFSLGRTVFSDFTALVIDHKGDGFSLGFEYPVASVNVSLAYTGLVLKGSSTISLSRADVADAASSSILFAPPRLLEMVQVTFPSLLGQDLTISGVFQEDMRDTALDLAGAGKTDLVAAGSTTLEPTLGGPVNTQYFGLGLKGTIMSSLYYELYSYLETGTTLSFTGGSYTSTPFAGILAGAGVRYYLTNLLSSVLGGKFLYVSGDPNGTTVVEGNTQAFSFFTPVSRSSLTIVFSPQLSNIMLAEASISAKPLSWLGGAIGGSVQAVLQADAYFRSTTGAISEPGIPPGNTDLYLGTETDLTINFHPVSDLAVSIAGGVFFPGSAFGSSPALRYKAGVDVSMSF